MTGERRKSSLLGKVERLFVIILGGFVAPLFAKELEPCVLSGGANQQAWFAQINVNSVTFPDLVQIYGQSGKLCMKSEDLRTAGLNIPTDPAMIFLDSVSGLKFNWDISLLQLTLNASAERLNRHKLSLVNQAPVGPDPSASIKHVALNYSAWGANFQNAPSLSTWSELHTQIADNITLSGSQNAIFTGSDTQYVRLDTSLEQDFPNQSISLTTGDFASGTPGWGRSVHMGGIRIFKNYKLNPYETTVPMANFSGDSVLPSTVDLYINGIRQASQAVSPGPFDIQAPALQSGAGNATMIVTDITGQKRQYTFDIYGAPELLGKGVLQGSAETGFVRLDPGEKSNDYAATPVLISSLRYGMSDQMTLESHAETGKSITLTGAGASWQWGMPGVVMVSAMHSEEQNAGEGWGWQVGYHWSENPFSLSVRKERNDVSFRDVASHYGGLNTPETWQIFVGTTTPIGEVGLGQVYLKDESGSVSQYRSLSWSRQIELLGSISLTLSTQLSNATRDKSLSLTWTLPLGEHLSGGTNAVKSQTTSHVMTGLTKTPGERGEGELGWHLMTAMDQEDTSSYQLDMTSLNHYGNFSAGGFRSQGRSSSTTTWASASGSVLFLQEGIFASSGADSAFALVSTSPVGGVPVKLENRIVGKTNGDGYALVTGLNSWQHNLITVDPLGLPAQYTLMRTNEDVIPASSAGVRVSFPVDTASKIQLLLHDEQGDYVPLNSPVWLHSKNSLSFDVSGSPKTRVGYGGLVYMDNPGANSTLLVGALKASQCQVPLSEDILNLALTGPIAITCVRQKV